MLAKNAIINAVVRSSTSYLSQSLQTTACRTVSTNSVQVPLRSTVVPKFYTQYTSTNFTHVPIRSIRQRSGVYNRSFSTATTAEPQAAAAAAASDQPKAIVENLIAEQKGFVSRALRDVAKAKYENLPISPRKLEYLCRLVRGMSVREALVQLRLCNKRKAFYLRRGIRTTANGAVNTFNMMKDRLIVDEIYATKGMYYKRLHVRARGRANIRIRRKSHLVIKLREQPYHKGEFRIGRYGRTIEHWKRVDRLADAWKLKRAEEAA